MNSAQPLWRRTSRSFQKEIQQTELEGREERAGKELQLQTQERLSGARAPPRAQDEAAPEEEEVLLVPQRKEVLRPGRRRDAAAAAFLPSGCL